MTEQPIVTYADFAAQAENEKWSKDRAVRVAFEWYEQADLIGRALRQLMHANVTLAATNDYLIDLLQGLKAVDLIDFAVLEQYKSLRMDEKCRGESLIRQGMELNEKSAARTAFSEQQRNRARRRRSRSPNSAKNLVTDAMHAWRRSCNGGTLQEFLAAVAEANNDYTVHIRELSAGKYVVECEGGVEADDGKKVSRRTLENWWKNSAT